MLATVFDVHPGMAGCTEPLPESLRLAAESMRGQRLPIQEIVGILRGSVPDGAFDVHHGFISYGCGDQLLVPTKPLMLVWQFN